MAARESKHTPYGGFGECAGLTMRQVRDRARVAVFSESAPQPPDYTSFYSTSSTLGPCYDACILTVRSSLVFDNYKDSGGRSPRIADNSDGGRCI